MPMRDDVAYFQLSGPVVRVVRDRAQRAGLSDDQFVERVLGAVLAQDDPSIVTLDCVEEEGAIVLDRHDGEDDDAYRSRTDLYAGLFGPDR
jgi:hypothetical protein